MPKPIDTGLETVLARFTVTGTPEEFEEVLREQTEFLQVQDGFARSTLLQSLRRPTTYLNVSWWHDEHAYRSVVRSVPFANYVFGRLMKLVKGDSERAEPVLAGSANDAATASAAVAVTTFELHEDASPQDFERTFKAHADFVRLQPGFVAHLLVRLAGSPRTYVNLGWWGEPGDHMAALATEEFRADVRAMGTVAEVSGDLMRVVIDAAA